MTRVHVRLSLGAVSIEFNGENEFFRRLIEPLVDAQARRNPSGAAPAGGPAAASAPPLRAPTLAERLAPPPPQFQPAAPQKFNLFVRQVGDRAQSPDQRLMAFAFYLWNYEKREEFSRTDAESFFRTLHDEGLDRTGELLADLWERRRFLEPGREEGLWRLTEKGLNYVKNRLLSAG